MTRRHPVRTLEAAQRLARDPRGVIEEAARREAAASDAMNLPPVERPSECRWDPCEKSSPGHRSEGAVRRMKERTDERDV